MCHKNIKRFHCNFIRSYIMPNKHTLKLLTIALPSIPQLCLHTLVA